MNNIQLSRNEQIGILLAAIAVMAVIFLGLYTFAGPRRAYAKSQADVVGLVDQLASFRSLKQQEEQRLARQETLMKVLAARPAGFNLFSFVDETIGKLEMRGFANTTNAPRGRDAKADKLDLVQLELRGVGLKQILDVLHALYASNNLIAVQRMDRLAPSQTNNGQGLDCTLILATLKP